jgi:thymidylate synthase (FAD)
MAHETNPLAEEILDKRFPVLDHGFVQLVDYMGGDRRIAEAAWVSSIDEVEAKKKTPHAMRRIINYMLEHGHTSPFEQVVLTYRCKMPIFVARQWVRHRTARLNEMSGRYRILPNEMYRPTQERLGGKGISNKQGTEGELTDELCERIIDRFIDDQREDRASYEWLSGAGLANELARINLPMAQYTEWYWQIDLHNLFHFIKLRLDSHAQWEIQQYAEALATAARVVAPIAWVAFQEFRLNAVTFSASEMEILRELVDTDWDAEVVAYPKLGDSRTKRFLAKLQKEDGGC